MVQIYKEQATITPTQETQKLADISGLEKQATSMQQTYDKQLKTYENEQINIGSQVMADAYYAFKDEPEKFGQTTKEGLSKIEETMTDPNAKIEFRTQMKLRQDSYNRRVETNFQTGVDKDERDSFIIQANHDLQAITDTIGSGNITNMVGSLNELYERKDTKGNYALTVPQRGEILELKEKPQYYSALAYTDELKNSEDIVTLTKEYNAVKNDPEGTKKRMGIGDAEYASLLKAMKPSGTGNSFANARVKTSLKTEILDIGADGKEIENDKYDKEDLFELKNKMDIALKNKEITNDFYSSQMPKINATLFNMEKTNMYDAGTAGRQMVEFADFDGGGDSLEANARKYDMMAYYSEKLEKAGIDPHSTSVADRITGANLVRKARGEWMISVYKNATEENVKTITGQNKQTAIYQQEQIINRAEVYLGLSKSNGWASFVDEGISNIRKVNSEEQTLAEELRQVNITPERKKEIQKILFGSPDATKQGRFFAR